MSFRSSLRSLTYEKSVVLSFPSGRVEVLMRHKKPEIKASDRFDLSRRFDKWGADAQTRPVSAVTVWCLIWLCVLTSCPSCEAVALRGGGVNIIYIIFHVVEFLDVRDKSNSQTNDGLHLL